MQGITSVKMVAVRLAARKPSAWPILNRKFSPSSPCVANKPSCACTSNNSIQRRLFSEQDKMPGVDPNRVVSYEYIQKVLQDPNRKVIIDVRNPEEVYNTGMIPSSINIPLACMQDVLSMSDEDFQRYYHRSKPSSEDELIFYCQSGRRSSEAVDKALKLGYLKSKTYTGSWNEWVSRQTTSNPSSGDAK